MPSPSVNERSLQHARRVVLPLLMVVGMAPVAGCGGSDATSAVQRPAKGGAKGKARSKGKVKKAAPDKGTKAAPPGGMPDLPTKAAAPADAPNVLLIVMDTTRADHLTPYGYGLDTTPRLAALAAEGMVYERAVSPGMWTLPSHASLFTGLPVTEHGANANHKLLDPKFTTMAEWFGEKGWDTFLFSANPYLQSHTLLNQGFDVAQYPWDSTWTEAATKATLSKLIDRDASNVLGPLWKQTTYPTGRPNDKVKDAGPVATEALTTWLDARPGAGTESERPWLAVVNYMEAHVPRIPSMESRKALFDQETIDKQLALDQAFPFLLAYTLQKHEYTDEEVAIVTSTYDAALRDLDTALGTVFDALEARGSLDNTIVVVTADHGEHLGEHHRIGHKYSVHNPLVRVPLIVRYPAGVTPGREPAVVSTLDVFGTVAGLAEVGLPEGTRTRSLLDPDSTGDDPMAFSELVAATPTALRRIGKVHKDLDETPWLRTYTSVERTDAKCIRGSDGVQQLYAMPDDALETVDLASTDAARTQQVCAHIDGFKAGLTPYTPGEGGTEAPKAPMDPATRARLEALGYLEAPAGDHE